MVCLTSIRLCRNLLRNATPLRFMAVYGRCSLTRINFNAETSRFSGCHDLVQSSKARALHCSTVIWKKKFTKRRVEQEEEKEEEEEETDEEDEEPDTDDLARDYRLVDCPVSALRVDTVAKVGLGVARTAVEQLMLEGKIRVDGQLCRKKAAAVNMGTTIDLLLEASPDNPDFTLVKRITVHKISDRSDNQGRTVVTVKKWASLTVDDYKIAGAGDSSAKES